ncbi:MAG: hypothetical protein Q4B52_05320 [Tissierellia bacterium]|nr:hypothetical protein [Tissierellia bacterium]
MSVIDSIYSPTTNGFGSNSINSFEILQKRATTSKPAKAELSFNRNLGAVISGDNYLGATVGNNKGKGGLRAY